jgi:hypothetical protein
VRARRWGDNDRYIGPFTIARQDRHWRPLGVILGSGGEDDEGAFLRFYLPGWTVILALPQWCCRPERKRVFLDDAYHRVPEERATRGYTEIIRREYGIVSSEGHLSVKYGKQTDATGEQRWCWFYPWKGWRHVRHSLYRPDGRLFADLPQFRRGMSETERRDVWTEDREITERCPTVTFAFLDFDGDPLTATCRIEEREWRKGEGWFRWLGWFRRPRIERYLDLRFSGETGGRKGSWKGGTIGASIRMRPSDGPDDAFQRYCYESRLTFVREPHLFERYGLAEKPEGWNNAVLGWFHRGPELREPGDEYRTAFQERTRQHEQRTHGTDSAVDDDPPDQMQG